MSDEKYLCVASITDAHALNGRLKIYIVSDNLNRFNKGNNLFLKQKNSYIKYEVDDFAVQKGRIGLLKLQGIDDRNTSESLKGAKIFITIEDAERTRDELDNDSFYYYDLIDCEVFIDDKKFGEVIDILEAGGGEILVIRDIKGREKMLPFIEKMVSIDRVKEKRLDIFPAEGLFDY